MNDLDRVKFLFGPYCPPPLKRGDRAFCLFRDRTVVVTSWTDARIPWPRCRPLNNPLGGSGLLVDEMLARAIQHESAAAICFWWRASEGAVWRWRKALGVTRTSSAGSRRLIHAAAKAGASAVRERQYTDEERAGRAGAPVSWAWTGTCGRATRGRGGPPRRWPCSASCPTPRWPSGRGGRGRRCAGSGTSWASPTRQPGVAPTG